ncbi:MAG: hypothetical protein JJE09_10950 [Bacteroidia bacterium]|nr:hypothetical protein [Bacteroidia bacterium]
MKTKYTLLTFVAVLGMFASFGQVEYDDMYFNSKDRAQLNASKQEVLASQYKKHDLQAVKSSPINPTDSYSGRSVNPEYTNRLKTNPSLAANESQYFVAGYNPVSVNQNLASNNCNCSNFYNSYGGYSMNRYGMNSGFGSPYNSFYSPWGMGGGYYQPGWSSMLGYSLGGMNSGWYGGMNYGYANSWGNPWNYGYGGGSYYNNYGFGSNYYGNNVVVINNSGDYRNPNVYGKRVNRSSDLDNTIDRSRPETGYARNGREAVNGRSRSDNQSQYYDRNWKRDPEKNPSRSAWSDNSSNSAGNQSRSGWNNQSTSTGRQNSDFGNSRTSFDSGSRGSSAGSMSTGSSSSGSSGSSRSRGRD